MSSPQNQSPASNPNPRPARSKNGCDTCRRRKVRCNEQRPRCSHCYRLNLDCTWIKTLSTHGGGYRGTSAPIRTTPGPIDHPAYLFLRPFGTTPFNGNEFLPSPSDDAGLSSLGLWPEYPMPAPLPQEYFTRPICEAPSPTTSANHTIYGEGTAGSQNAYSPSISRSLRDETAFLTSPSIIQSPRESHNSPTDENREYLLNAFLQMCMPPILAPVEIGPKWSTTQALFTSMSSESPMVRFAITAFSASQLSRFQMGVNIDFKLFYDSALKELHEALKGVQNAGNAKGGGGGVKELKHILAAVFLLIYADLLTQRLPQAHANLKEAYLIIKKAQRTSFTAAERRLISWIRLLDARAVSTAGGEGLFLKDTADTELATSPASTQESYEPGSDDTINTEIDEILLDVLFQPGIVFYQKVQSFVGRITMIDPWHRNRGTVEDETQVMAIAEQISRDLQDLYRQRPALMDHAVEGNLTEKHLAKNLALATTRSFRTYLANYYACFVHLHRVAYRQYPATKDLTNALAKIKWLCHIASSETGSDENPEPLPVSFLWPLLMWGCEEENADDRVWIFNHIRALESVASNAKATAELLEWVQMRQDKSSQRIDVRSISEEVFPQHFAIL